MKLKERSNNFLNDLFYVIKDNKENKIIKENAMMHNDILVDKNLSKVIFNMFYRVNQEDIPTDDKVEFARKGNKYLAVIFHLENNIKFSNLLLELCNKEEYSDIFGVIKLKNSLNAYIKNYKDFPFERYIKQLKSIIPKKPTVKRYNPFQIIDGHLETKKGMEE